MYMFWKYLLCFLSFLTIIIIYLFNSSLGHHSISQLLSVYISQKSNNDLEVSSLDINNYPKFSMNIKINNSAIAYIKGTANRDKFNVDYHIKGENLKYNNIHIKHRVDIRGSLCQGESEKKYLYKMNIIKSNHKEFFSRGEIDNSNKYMTIIGSSSTFDGLLTYKYNQDTLTFHLDGLSLVKLLYFFSYPPILSAKVYGNVDDDIKNRVIRFDTKWIETKFRKTELTDKIFTLTGIDILQESYDNSSFLGAYQDSTLYANLKIDNGEGRHLYFTDLRLNSKTDLISSKIEFGIVGRKLYGKLGGTLKEPKVSIDIKRVIKSQLPTILNRGTEDAFRILDKLF